MNDSLLSMQEATTGDVLKIRWDRVKREFTVTFTEDFWDESKHNNELTSFEGQAVTRHEAVIRGAVRRLQAVANTGEMKYEES